MLGGLLFVRLLAKLIPLQERAQTAKQSGKPVEPAALQAATRFVERRGGGFFGGGRSNSTGTRNRARRRCTIAMLSPFLPRTTSLTRLGVPSTGRGHVV